MSREDTSSVDEFKKYMEKMNDLFEVGCEMWTNYCLYIEDQLDTFQLPSEKKNRASSQSNSIDMNIERYEINNKCELFQYFRYINLNNKIEELLMSLSERTEIVLDLIRRTENLKEDKRNKIIQSINRNVQTIQTNFNKIKENNIIIERKLSRFFGIEESKSNTESQKKSIPPNIPKGNGSYESSMVDFFQGFIGIEYLNIFKYGGLEIYKKELLEAVYKQLLCTTNEFKITSNGKYESFTERSDLDKIKKMNENISKGKKAMDKFLMFDDFAEHFERYKAQQKTKRDNNLNAILRGTKLIQFIYLNPAYTRLTQILGHVYRDLDRKKVFNVLENSTEDEERKLAVAKMAVFELQKITFQQTNMYNRYRNRGSLRGLMKRPVDFSIQPIFSKDISMTEIQADWKLTAGKIQYLNLKHLVGKIGGKIIFGKPDVRNFILEKVVTALNENEMLEETRNRKIDKIVKKTNVIHKIRNIRYMEKYRKDIDDTLRDFNILIGSIRGNAEEKDAVEEEVKQEEEEEKEAEEEVKEEEEEETDSGKTEEERSKVKDIPGFPKEKIYENLQYLTQKMKDYITSGDEHVRRYAWSVQAKLFQKDAKLEPSLDYQIMLVMKTVKDINSIIKECNELNMLEIEIQGVISDFKVFIRQNEPQG